MYSLPSYEETTTKSMSAAFQNPAAVCPSRLSSKVPSIQLPSSCTPKSRGPSQKKLSLTSQTSGSVRNLTMFNDSSVKKVVAEGLEVKQKFLSLQPSFIAQANKEKRQVQRNYMNNLKLQMQQKLQRFMNFYARALKQLSFNIQQLQARLQKNEVELKKKNKQIEVLQSLCKQYKNQLQQKFKMPHKNSQHMLCRMEDAQKKICILGQHFQQMNKEQQKKYEYLACSIISYFGNKMQSIKNQSNAFVNKAVLKLSAIESRVHIQSKVMDNIISIEQLKSNTCLKMNADKQSERTQSSTESIGQSSIINQEHEQGISFWDDCFFYPSQKSENSQLITQMAKRRGEALHCWLDQCSFLRYYESNSFIYNRRGDRIQLTNKEIKQLIEQNLLIL